MVDADGRRVRLITDLAMLTLLVDRNIIEVEETIQRIDLIQRLLPEEYQSAAVTEGLTAVVHFLRSRNPS